MHKIFIIILLCISFTSFSKDFNIVTFGAKADGKTMNTRSIQAAIDACSEQEDRVIIPHGTFVSGTLYMKNGTELHLMEGAVLLGSASFIDYPENEKVGATSHRRALIYGYNLQDVIISGKGMINGNGMSDAFQLGDDSGPKGNQGRPEIILMINCKNIKVENVSLKNSAFWMQNYVGCENVHLKGLTIYNHANFNNDGIDIDCKSALIEDCIVDSDDDAICLKSHDKDKPCENIIIRNCVVSTNCNAVKFGTTSRGGFRNVTISNITIKKASEDRIRNWQKHTTFIEQSVTVLTGIAIENSDGGITDNIAISNIFMSDVQTPIFIKLGNRLANKVIEGMAIPSPGHIRNVTISNVSAVSHSKITSSITGYPGYDIDNIHLNNIRINSMGNGTSEDAYILLPENEKLYPAHTMFGQVHPSSGLFVRHVNGISIDNMSLSTRNIDRRVNMMMEDVKNAQISLFRTTDTEVFNSILKLIDCQNICWNNPQVDNAIDPILQVDGAKTNGIYIKGANQFKKNNWLVASPSVPVGVITIN